MLLSTIATLVCTRVLSVCKMIESGSQVCVCAPSRLDVAGELALFFFATSALVLKELDVDPETSLIVTGILSVILYAHGLAAGFL